jgi:hypothetical protein
LLRPLKIFSKICGDIHKSRCNTDINDTSGKIATGVNDTGVNDTGGKFATGVNDTGGKFATGVNDANGKLPPISMTLAANLPLV